MSTILILVFAGLGLVNILNHASASVLSNYKIYVNGEELTDGQELDGSELISISFDWSFVNNTDDSSFEENLRIRGLKITANEGPLYYQGDEIGTYNLSPDGVLHLTLNDNAKKYSDIEGGAILDATLDVSDDRSEKDHAPLEIGFGDTIKNITYSNPGVVLFNKNSTTLQYDIAGKYYYLEYRLTFTAQDIMDSITIHDDLDPISQLIDNSLAVRKDNNLITDTVDIVKDEHSFTISLPAINSKLKHEYVITYRVSIDATTENLRKSEIKNSATLTYTNENDEEKEITKETSYRNTKPTLTKKVQSVTTNDSGKIVTFKNEYNNKHIIMTPVQYSVVIKPNDYRGVFRKHPELNLNLHDSFSGETGDIILDDNYMFHNNTFANGPIARDAYINDSSAKFFDSDLINVNASSESASNYHINSYSQLSNRIVASDADLVQQLKNTAKLFGITGSSIGEHANYDIKVSDFAYDESRDEYVFNYIVLVPIDSYSTTIGNNVGLTIDDINLTSNAELKIEISPSAMITKHVIGDEISDEVNFWDDSFFQYDNDDTERETVDYVAAISFDSLRHPYTRRSDGSYLRGNYSQDLPLTASDLNEIGHIKIVDKLNKECHASGCRDSYERKLGIGEPFSDSFVIDVYRDFSKYTPTIGSELIDARQRYYNYIKNYGAIGSERAGFNQTRFMTLYNNFINAYNSLVENKGYLGSITYSDIVNAPDAYSFNLDDNGFSIDFLNPTTNMINATYFDEKTTDGNDNRRQILDHLNLEQFVFNDTYFVIRYTADVLNPDWGTAHELANSLSVYYDDDTDTTDDKTPWNYVNNIDITDEYDWPHDDELFPSISKKATSVTFKDRSFDFNQENKTIGWLIEASFTPGGMPEPDPESLSIGNRSNSISILEMPEPDFSKITITDTLPDELLPLDYSNSENLIAYSLRAGPGQNPSSNNFGDVELDPSLYTVRVEGKTITIEIPYSEEFYNAVDFMYLGSDGGKIVFYLKTAIDESIFVNQSGKSLTINNTATLENGFNTVRGRGSANITIPRLVEKEALDATNMEVIGKPYRENGYYKANYRLEVNPKSVNMSDDTTVKVQDTMTGVMLLDRNSIKGVDGDTGETVEISYQVNDNVIEFTIPDQRHILIYYSVKFNIDPVEDINWMRVENTNNKVQIAVGTTPGVSDEIDFRNYHDTFAIWVRNITGKITVNKYYQDKQKKHQPISNVGFELHSVYDNTGKIYNNENDDVFARFNQISTDENGNYTFSNLPLDRIYKLVETQPAEGFKELTENEFYFVLVGKDGVDVNKYCTDNRIENCNIKTYQSADIIEIENEKIPSDDDTPEDDTPEEDTPKENPSNPGTNSSNPAIYFIAGGIFVAALGLVAYKRFFLQIKG